MPSSCEVCSSEPSKYRCPTCALMSCSLACTQSHKIYCAPKPQPSNESTETSTPIAAEHTLQNGVTDHQTTEGGVQSDKQSTPASIANSPEVTALFRRHPELRDQLHEIYQSTLEDEWVEWYTPPSRGRFNGRGGRAPARRSRGPWNTEKGFNRGMGRVRKFRQDCEEGSQTGTAAEAFMRFWTLVNNNQSEQVDQAGGLN